jgi:protocatechuate 3,4-dioxygenase beta subunit
MKSVLVLGVLAAGTLAAQGSIEGQVFNAATGAPLKKTMVRLNALNSPGQGYGGQQAQQGRMPVNLAKETDDQGNFSFTGLDPGRYSLSAQRTGFLRQSYGARHFNTNGVPIVLTQDQHIKNLAFRLAPQSVIVGKVIDEDGEPAAHVLVQALKYAYRGGKKQWSQVENGQTSDIGEYRMANLEPGRYLIRISPRNLGEMVQMSSVAEPMPDKPEMVMATTYYPNAADTTGGAPIDVAPGAEVRGIDIRLRKVASFRVRGKVVVPGGTDRMTTSVMLSSADGGGNIESMGMARQPDGRFEIRGVAPGSYIAHAQIRNSNQQMIGMQTVQVGSAHVDNVVLTLSPSFDIPGTVRVAESHAKVNLQNVNVMARPVGFIFGGMGRGKTGDDAKFTLKNVMPQRFTVDVANPPDGCFVQSIKYAGQEVTAAGVEPNGGAPLEIVLSATAGQVTGAVTDKDGKPVAGAAVVLFSKSTPAAGPWNMFTDENGSFTFKGLKPGDYKLLSFEDVEPGAYTDPEFIKPWESRASDVKLDPSGKAAVQYRVISAEETAK